MELPTEAGSVIGWCMWYDDNNYGSAVLSNSDDHEDLAWWKAGFPDPVSQDQMRASLHKVGMNWEYLGRITPARTFERTHD